MNIIQVTLTTTKRSSKHYVFIPSPDKHAALLEALRRRFSPTISGWLPDGGDWGFGVSPGPASENPTTFSPATPRVRADCLVLT